METTIEISKVVTMMQSQSNGTRVSMHRFNELNSLIANISSFTLTGTIKEEKFKKYVSQITDLGFIICDVIYQEPMFETAVCFRINFSK